MMLTMSSIFHNLTIETFMILFSFHFVIYKDPKEYKIHEKKYLNLTKDLREIQPGTTIMFLNKRYRFCQSTSYLYMFPYCFNVSFLYFSFVPAFWFRFQKSGYRFYCSIQCELNISCTSTTAESRAKIWYQCGSSVVRHLPLVLEVPGSIPARGEKNFGVRTRFL